MLKGDLSTPVNLEGEIYRGVGASDYNNLENKPSINGDELVGNMSLWQPKNFSTEEQNTGLKWIDGKDIYFKTFNVTLNANTIIISETTNIDKIILIIGFVNVQSDKNIVYTLPYADSDDFISFGLTSSGINIYLSDWFKTRSPIANPTIFYTKN